MISPESKEKINEYLARKNGILRAMVAIVGFIALVTGYIAYDLKRDAIKKDLAREGAVADLKKVAQINDAVGQARYDSLAAQIQELREMLGIWGQIPNAPKLDTAKFKEQFKQEEEK